MRAEWYTSYTPYQPEISQGTLQAIFEFQTIVSELFGLGVANASMYDGASAAAEAVLMARRLTGKRHAIVAGALHPALPADHRRPTSPARSTAARSRSQHRRLRRRRARRSSTALNERARPTPDDVACVVVQSPNFFGVVEDLQPIAELGARARARCWSPPPPSRSRSACSKSPGALGADIAVGEGLGLAIPPTMRRAGRRPVRRRAEYLRQLPGRLVGETVDKDGRRGYVLTLATREQHIRREKATSNICTNQGLIALAFTIHLCLLGKRGFVELARAEPRQGGVRQGADRRAARLRARRSAGRPSTSSPCACAAATRSGPSSASPNAAFYAGVAATAPGTDRSDASTIC